MQIQFNYQHVSGSTELENFTKEKLQVIADRYSWVTRADVFYRVENTESKESGMIAEIRLSAPVLDYLQKNHNLILTMLFLK